MQFKAHSLKRTLRIALIADATTSAALEPEANITHLTPLNAGIALRLSRPDFMLVESAWQGQRNSWKYRIAKYPGHPERNNQSLARTVALARKLGIPTIFWNKEDGVHFDRFIDSAILFDHIFTVDANCIPRYRAVAPAQVTVEALPFAIQPRLHCPQPSAIINRACFLGSYSRHIHSERRSLQHQLFDAAAKSLGLSVYDRNSARRSIEYRYPESIPMELYKAVSPAATAQIYRQYLVSLNVNTVQDSPTMYSRRLVEILACAGIAVTTPALSVQQNFSDYCHVVQNGEEASTLLSRLRHGASRSDIEMAHAGADAVRKSHTWAHRLQDIMRTAGL